MYKYLILLLSGCSLGFPNHYIPKCHNLLRVSSDVPSRYLPDIISAAAIVNKHLGRPDIILIEYPSESNTSGIHFLKKWNGDHADQAIASLGLIDNYVHTAVIKINAENYEFNTGSSISVDMESVVLHEMFHVVGYMHDNNPHSVMYPYLTLNTIRLNDLPDPGAFQCWENKQW